MAPMRHAGFTLVEILVVLLIVSVMAGVTVISLPSINTSNDFEAEVKRLEVLLELARDEALMQSSELGFRIDRDRFGLPSGYSFYIYDDLNQVWTGYDRAPFKARRLEGDVRLSLQIEGDAERFRLDDEDENLPPVMLLSSGETTPFDLIISQADDSVTLRADGYTRIERVTDEF